MDRNLLVRLMSNHFQSYQQVHALEDLKSNGRIQDTDLSEAKDFLTCFSEVPTSVREIIDRLENSCESVKDFLLDYFDIDQNGDISWNEAGISDDIDEYVEDYFDTFFANQTKSKSISKDLSHYYLDVLRKIEDYPKAKSSCGISVQGCWYLYVKRYKDLLTASK